MKNKSIQLVSAALLLAAAPALRADDHGNDPATRSTVASGDHGGKIDHPGDQDWFRIRPSLGGPASLFILAARDTDPAPTLSLVLHDAAGRRITGFTSANRNRRIDVALTAHTTYYASVAKGAPGVSYRLGIRLPQDARPFSPKLLQGRIRTSNDTDLFTFSIPATGRVMVNSRPPTATQPPVGHRLELLNSLGQRLRFTHSQHNGIGETLNPGTYFVRAIATGPLGPYAIELNHNGNTDGKLEPGGNHIQFEVAHDLDYHRVVLRKRSTIHIRGGANSNAGLKLYNSAGAYLSGGSRVRATLNPGTYYLVSSNKGLVGRVNLTYEHL
jgi:hypothetical protein